MASRPHGRLWPSTMYWSGRAIGDTRASRPAPSSSAMTASGARRMLVGGPRCALGLKSTMNSLPPGRSAAARPRAYSPRSARWCHTCTMRMRSTLRAARAEAVGVDWIARRLRSSSRAAEGRGEGRDHQGSHGFLHGFPPQTSSVVSSTLIIVAARTPAAAAKMALCARVVRSPAA